VEVLKGEGMDTKQLRKAGIAVFLATDEKVAQDISDKLNSAASEIDRLRTELMVAECQLEKIKQ